MVKKIIFLSILFFIVGYSLVDGKMAASVFQTMTEVRASNVEKAGQFLDYALARRIPSSQVKIKVKCTLGRFNFEF